MSRKCNRHSKDLSGVFFPDDERNDVRESKGTPLSASSSAKSWAKCGESFLDTPMTKSPKSLQRNASAMRKLALSNSADLHNEDPVHIAWSSSESGQSDSEIQEQQQDRVVTEQHQEPPRTGKSPARMQSHIKSQRMVSPDKGTHSIRGLREKMHSSFSDQQFNNHLKDDLVIIDTDSDLDKSEEDAEKNTEQQISDCESAASFGNPEGSPLQPRNASEKEISGYVPDGESIVDTMALSRVDSKRFPLQTYEGSKRSVSDWVRSAHAMLQTPRKAADRLCKTPEDSGKKKQKLQSGGLAERLKRLQCRQKSAISFWRHQSIPEGSAKTTVDRPGVLVLEVLGVQEECSMQLVYCKHHQSSEEGHICNLYISGPSVPLVVLFNRETAGQLCLTPEDIIHIYPPWQNLSIETHSSNIILNTHFSQKVYSSSKPSNMAIPRGLLSAERSIPYSLCRIFVMSEVYSMTDQDNSKQVAVSDSLCNFKRSGVTRPSLSLLEAIEGLGQAGSVGQDVLVVVQRVYSIPVPDCSPVSILKPRVTARSSSVPPLTEKGNSRLCILVQDSYGMFSVVQLHILPFKEALHHYCCLWQGKACTLRDIKVVQRVTRERHTRLFTLIDSMWSPVVPLQYQENKPSQSVIQSPGPPPGFCYLLSGLQGSVEPTDSPTVSQLYSPPTEQTLQDILLDELKSECCSFSATVLVKRMQNSNVGQGEVLLVLTDPSLQQESPERPSRRTVALCVNTSCVLTSSVLSALNSTDVCRMSFRDAIKEHGALLCVEHSVVELISDVQMEASFDSAASHQPLTKHLPKPVRLDPLDLNVTPNSLCTLTGLIVGIDKNTAYTWPACNHCGSDNLETSLQRHQNFHCVACNSAVHKPTTKIQLEVFLSSASLCNCTIKVKLKQKTIMSILNISDLECYQFPGNDIESLLGKEVGPLTVYVHIVMRKPTLWLSLEEIIL